MKDFKLTSNGFEKVSKQELESFQELLDSHSKDLYYLAFDKQLFGYSPLGTWLKNNEELSIKSQEIIDELIEKKEVYSLFPKEKLSIYPIELDHSKSGYHIDLTNNEKNFADILYMNDKVYKTKYMFVDFGHLEEISQQDFDLIIDSLKTLLSKSKILKEIYFEYIDYLGVKVDIKG